MITDTDGQATAPCLLHPSTGMTSVPHRKADPTQSITPYHAHQCPRKARLLRLCRGQTCTTIAGITLVMESLLAR